MDFEKEKKEFLHRKDKSKKGSIDKKIRKLVDKINSLEDFFTTSSCAGRILLIERHPSGRKDKSNWLYLTHDKTSFAKIKKENVLKNIPKNNIWFRMEPVILHVACQDLEKAKKFLNVARDSGFRRSGIISLGKNRITMELVSTESIYSLISKDNKLLVDGTYLKVLIKEGNDKLGKTWEKINRLKEKISSVFTS
ncbi:hypothetical protein ISS07_05840 [Candidatus Woesearchaeota archaeon]|nr:hypothetical protein [Candidatus Woesearchaeota archaeon]